MSVHDPEPTAAQALARAQAPPRPWRSRCPTGSSSPRSAAAACPPPWPPPTALAAAAAAARGSGRRPLSRTQAARRLSAASDELLRRAEDAQDSRCRAAAQLRDMHRHGDTLESLRAAEAGDMLSLGGDGGGASAPTRSRPIWHSRRGGDPGGHRQMGHLTGTAPSPTARRLRGISQAAAGGDPLGVNLGYMLMKGLGGAGRTPPRRSPCLSAARRSMGCQPLNALGVMYWNGHGVEKDTARAREYFEEAAAIDDPDGHFNLGSLHLQEWRAAVAAGGEVEAQEGEGDDGVLCRPAYEAFQAAQDAGHWRAPHQLGHMYLHGQGVRQNCSEGLRFLRVFVSERSEWGAVTDDTVNALEHGESELGALIDFVLTAEQGRPRPQQRGVFAAEARTSARGGRTSHLLLQPGQDHAGGDEIPPVSAAARSPSASRCMPACHICACLAPR